MSNRGYIGTWRTDRQASRKPISATDGVVGIIMLLGYYAGGKSLFPNGVNPDMFIDEIGWVPGAGRAVFTDDEQLSGLTENMSTVLERHIKTVTSGSLKVYLSHIRNGRYPNGGGVCPAFNTVYRRDGTLIIYPRNWEADIESSAWEDVPAWVREMVATESMQTPESNL